MMEEPKRRLIYTEAYKLMDSKDSTGKNKPFSIKFVTTKGVVCECENCLKTVSFNKKSGMRRIILNNGEFRNVYDVLILQINDTRILVK